MRGEHDGVGFAAALTAAPCRRDNRGAAGRQSGRDTVIGEEIA